jgi:hypothetical protein
MPSKREVKELEETIEDLVLASKPLTEPLMMLAATDREVSMLEQDREYRLSLNAAVGRAQRLMKQRHATTPG